jgi:hypothetical protein
MQRILVEGTEPLGVETERLDLYSELHERYCEHALPARSRRRSSFHRCDGPLNRPPIRRGRTRGAREGGAALARAVPEGRFAEAPALRRDRCESREP